MNRRRMAWALWAVLVLCRDVISQTTRDQPWNVTRVGQIGGACYAVQVVGPHAYIGEGPNLTILEASAPSSPVVVGRLSLGDFFVAGIHLNGAYAYIAGSSRLGSGVLEIVDVTNPRLPQLRGSYPTPGGALAVYVAGGLAYVGCGSFRDSSLNGVQIIDVANPSSPTLRGSFHTAGYTWKVFRSGGTVYLCADDGLYILDVTNPSSPRRLGLYSSRDCTDVFVASGLAYIASSDHGLEVVDVTSPSAPIRRGRLFGWANGLTLSGGLVYLAGAVAPAAWLGVAIIDVTNPSSPTLRGSLPTSGTAQAIVVSGGMAYLADYGGGLSIIDVTNPSRPTVRSTYDTLSDPKDVYVTNGVACVANGVRGLKTIDVSNSKSPRVLGSYATPSAAKGIASSGGLAYLTEGNDINPHTLLQIVDATTPSSPRLRGSYTPATPWDVFVSGGMAYMPYGGVLMVDVTKPSSPTFRGLFDTPGIAHDLFVSGGVAYVADNFSLQIIDVRNPSAPFRRSSFGGSSDINNVFVSNGIAYVTGHWEWPYPSADFVCLDVTNPNAPALRGRYQAPIHTGASGLSVSNTRAYVVWDGLHVLDVRNPSRPTLCGFYPTGPGCNVFVSGEMIYVTDSFGLRIFQYTGPTPARHWQLYP